MGAFERHYSVAEISAMWGYSEQTIRRLFSDEPGVLRIGSPETRFKRKRFQLSIPESVVTQMHQRLCSSGRRH
jgi:AraC-like DNA-binding protein